MTDDIVARLRTALGPLLMREAADEIEQLRVALAWYADKTNYDPGQDCEDILIDGGAIARRALGAE